MTVVKICGIRSLEEGRAALEAGADMLGFVFWEPSRRFISPAAAASIIRRLRDQRSHWSAVGVFVNPTATAVTEADQLCSLEYVQLSGNEDPARVRAISTPTIKAVHVRSGAEAAAAESIASGTLGATLYLLDTHRAGLYGGTGETFDWAALRGVGSRCLVGGGLRPDNVIQALEILSPLGVDVSSGVEFPGGGKDPEVIRAFMEAVKTYDSRLAQQPA